MALFTTLSTALTAKATAGVAATVLAGAGLSVAVDTVDTPQDQAEERLEELEGAIDETSAPVPDLEADASLQGGASGGQADEVHAGLTAEGELRPGADGFGDAVAEQARDRAEDAADRAADTVPDDADGRTTVDAEVAADVSAAAESEVATEHRSDVGSDPEGSEDADAGDEDAGQEDAGPSAGHGDATTRIKAETDHATEAEAGLEQSVTAEQDASKPDSTELELEADAEADLDAETTTKVGIS